MVCFSVVYFDQLSGALKAGQTTSFSRFQPFIVDFKTFSVISRLKSTKNVQNRTKRCVYLLLKAG